MATGDWRLATGDWRLATGDMLPTRKLPPQPCNYLDIVQLGCLVSSTLLSGQHESSGKRQAASASSDSVQAAPLRNVGHSMFIRIPLAPLSWPSCCVNQHAVQLVVLTHCAQGQGLAD